MRRRFLNKKSNSIHISYESQYFTIEALEDGLTVKLSQNASEYCVDGGDWKSLAANAESVSVNTGQNIQFRINNPTILSGYGIGTFTISKKCNVSGNIMSLIYGDDFSDKTDLTGKIYVFYALFSNCKSIISSRNLILPSIILSISCYSYMFSGCRSLKDTPVLPATKLADSCYYGMFYDCTILTTAPELPAIVLEYSCYSYMFDGCTSLTTAPSLPATTLASYCYSYMFSSCTGLTTAPSLPATKLADSCYYYMFSGCRSLKDTPVLPATTLANRCYYSMFSSCTSLTTAPSLPATTLADSCYYYMFFGCTSLTTAPSLPATTLANRCYSYMFDGCTSLTSAPKLIATMLVYYCYYCMFRGCSKLSKITMLATDISATSCLLYWVNGVASTGTFVKHPNMTSLPSGINGIPEGWTVVNDGETNLITFTLMGIKYQAEEGTTWGEWVNDDMSYFDFQIQNNYIYFYNNMYLVPIINSSSQPVHINDIIQKDDIYYYGSGAGAD